LLRRETEQRMKSKLLGLVVGAVEEGCGRRGEGDVLDPIRFDLTGSDGLGRYLLSPRGWFAHTSMRKPNKSCHVLRKIYHFSFSLLI
jgi:hypothetical protein